MLTWQRMAAGVSTRRTFWSTGAALAVLGLSALGGCQGGVLTIKQGTVTCQSSADCGFELICSPTQSVCVPSPGPCSSVNPEGDCPQGSVCHNGMCMCGDPEVCSCPGGQCQTTWCEGCAPEQGCDEGACVDIINVGPEANSCAANRLDGVCPGGRSCCGGGACCPSGEICVGSQCVPNQHPCSPSEPAGWCGPDLACVQGRCVAESVCACSPENLTGCCESGKQCSDGACADAQCGAGVWGACPKDQICNATGCEPLPCSPSHVTGTCPSPQFCSTAGECKNPGECSLTSDCLAGETYCAASGTCIDLDTCEVDDDCEIGQASSYGQGFICDNEGCIQRVNCPNPEDECVPSQFCTSGHICRDPGQCDTLADCDGSQICASDHYCREAGGCGSDDDCTGLDEYCASNGKCLPEGTCVDQRDCPPVHECQRADAGDEYGTCQRSGVTCDSNVLLTSGCAGGGLYCCETGKTCCSYNERCSSLGNCIPLGQCATDDDCLSPDMVCEDYVCVPATPCGGGCAGQCVSVEYAPDQWISGCVPAGNCATNSDCQLGEFCDRTHVCMPDPTCGGEFLSLTSRVPPNVLVLLDRSSSMNVCGTGNSEAGQCGYTEPDPADCTTNPSVCSARQECVVYPGFPSSMKLCACNMPETGTDTTTRWTQALNAVGELADPIEGFGSRINFGLGYYPDAIGSPQCPVECNWFQCTGRNFGGGSTIYAVGSQSAHNALSNLIGLPVPGGATPTAYTLRSVLETADRFGLNATDRANAILLVTDGEATEAQDRTIDVKACAPDCDDGVQNGDETGEDCGGSCPACPDGIACKIDNDCASGICRVGVCRPTTCANDATDAGETALNCGGLCAPCADNQPCDSLLPEGCSSGKCTDPDTDGSYTCEPANCDDLILNGAETAVDCGGGTCDPCPDTTACLVDRDCASNVCAAGKCRPATCRDTDTNNGETDRNCGGQCPPCAPGQGCSGDGDCTSGDCAGTTCAAMPLCQNGVLDAGNEETDVDCGGSHCPPCGPGRLCTTASDCVGDTPVCNACIDCDACEVPASCPQCYPASCATCTDVTTGPCAACNGAQLLSVEPACEVNVALDQLYVQNPRVRTFVVGFAFGGVVSPALNCHAVHGRTAKKDGACATMTPENCSDGAAPACYYEANDQASLLAALGTIMEQVSACRYNLPGRPPNLDLLFTYLESTLGAHTRKRVAPSEWEYHYDLNQIQFYGTACSDLESGKALPLLILACPEGTGG